MAADPTPGREPGVPDEAARRLYLAILAAGGRIAADRVPDSDQASLDLLVELGLVMPNRTDGWHTAVSPRAVSERISSEMRAEATRLLAHADSLPGILDGLARAYDAVPRTAESPGDAEYIRGHQHIRHRIAQLVSECKEEMLTAQPGTRPAGALEVAISQDVLLLKRGAALRTLYQPLVLAEPAAVGYAATVTGHGAAVRVLDEPFQRMIVIDRSVAIVPAADDYSLAAFITDPAAIKFLIGVFDRDWARADVVRWGEISPQNVARSVADRVGRLLSQGFTQRTIASRLGLSERTVAGHIARLRERYGARTLFQLGWLMRGGRGE